jgi:selenocysteine lyase/cysteine desulfurase
VSVPEEASEAGASDAGHTAGFAGQVAGHYLDTATYGLPPSSTVEAIATATDRWRRGVADWRAEWELEAEGCRHLFAQLVQVSANAVALMPAVSVATGIVASVVPPGAEVLVAQEDFASLLYPFLEAERRGALRVRAVSLDRLVDEVASETALVAVSYVQSADGEVADVAALRRATDEVGAGLYLDATHAVGVLPPSGAAWSADYLSCAAYKWLCCPRGVAFLYVAPQRWSRPASIAASWRGEARPYAPHYGPPLELVEDARRFDVSIAWHAWVGARSALDAIVAVGDERRFGSANGLAGRLADLLELPPPRSAIVTVPVRDGVRARAALDRAGVRATVRRDTVRLSPHFYNAEPDIHAAVAALRPHRSSR